MKPFFCYYGGKWRIARKYPSPIYPLIVEPFAGAAGYSTRFGAHSRVLLADRDPVLARLWQWLIAATPEDVRALPLIGAGEDVRELSLEPGARDLIGFWLNKGSSHPCNKPSAWMRGGTRPNSYWGPVIRERVASQVRAIRQWRCLNSSYADLPDVEATWFIDPPYVGRAGTHYVCGSAQLDYAHLAEWCRSRRGQVIVCENQGARWLPFAPFGVFRSNPQRDASRRTAEAVWETEQ